MRWPPDRAALEAAFVEACDLELRALKPGNVHVHAAGHGMTVEDFRASARAAAPPLCAPGAPVGRRVGDAMAATWAAVGCNTNLGILLLAAPLVAAAERGEADPRGVLAALTVADAADAYAAIRLAKPAGLGSAAAQDVAEAPTVTLLDAMRLAAPRDRVAQQYATGYADVLGRALPAFDLARAAGATPERAAALAFLDLLAAFPDTHIARKHGAAAAESVRARAAALPPEPDTAALLALDAELKAQGLNPGTTADLTVACLLAAALRPSVPA
jgi:triphosphoribosyl-dephospho-CoA synthase